MRTRALRLFALLLLVALPGLAQTVIAGDINADTASSVSTATAAATLIGPLGENLSFGGFAYDTSTGTMYGSDFAIPADESFGLASINLTTGAATLIGSHVNSHNIWGLAYDSRNNVLYGADGSNNGLATINRATGVSTVIGPYLPLGGQLLVCGLAYDAAADILYGVTSVPLITDAGPRVVGHGRTLTNPSGFGATSLLVTLNRATGAATTVGALGVNLDAADVRCGLELDPASGALIAGAYDGTLYRVNKATGAATLIGNSGLAIDALGAVPVTSVLAIPTLSIAGLALLALVLGGVGMLALRRRRAA